MLNNKSQKNIMLTTMIISLSLALNYSCSTTPNNTSTPSTSTKNVDYGRKIVGKATFPETRKAKVDFRIKANTSEVSKISTISLILPHDATSNQNKTIATGVTDSDGNFLIDTTKITLTPNIVYILEASKRSESNNIMTIRTLIKWNGNEWAGIAQSGEVLIDQNTTALSAIANLTNTESDKLILSLPVESGITTGADIANTAITKNDVKNVGDMVSSILQGGRDPIALLRYDASKSYKYYVDQTYNYKSLTTDNGCNGCSFIGADLKTSGSSLVGKDLSYADLRGQDLSQADLSGTILIGANLEGATLPQDLSYLNLSYTNLKGQDLTQSDVTGTNLSNAILDNCNLTGLDLSKTRLYQANFSNSKLNNANLKKVNLFKTIYDNTDVTGLDLTDSNLSRADLSSVKNKDANGLIIKGATLDGANLSNLKLSDKDLTNVKFKGGVLLSKADLSGKSFSEIDFSSSDFSEAIIDNVKFDRCNLSKSNFQNIDASNLVIMNSDLRDSNFSEAKIKNSVLNILKMDNSDLSKAEITSCSIDGVSFTLSDMSYSIISSSSILNSNISYTNLSNSNLSGSNFDATVAKEINLENAQPPSVFQVTSLGKTKWFNGQYCKTDIEIPPVSYKFRTSFDPPTGFLLDEKVCQSTIYYTMQNNQISAHISDEESYYSCIKNMDKIYTLPQEILGSYSVCLVSGNRNPCGKISTNYFNLNSSISSINGGGFKYTKGEETLYNLYRDDGKPDIIETKYSKVNCD